MWAFPKGWKQTIIDDVQASCLWPYEQIEVDEGMFCQEFCGNNECSVQRIDFNSTEHHWDELE